MIKLLQGDCLEIMKDIPDKSIDMILCDLPFGITACKWDSVVDLDKLWKQYSRIIKDGRAIILFGQEPFSSRLRMSNIKNYRYDWVWQKEKPSNFQLMHYQAGRVHENIMVFSNYSACYTSNNKSMIYYPQKSPREIARKSKVKCYGGAELLHKTKSFDSAKAKTYEDKLPISILKYNAVPKRVHPTQKPVELLEYLIKTYTNESDLVLDNCMGSGSTALACINTHRQFIGIELDETYYKIAKDRVDNAYAN